MKGEKILYDQTQFPTYRIEYETLENRVEFKVFEVKDAYSIEASWVIGGEDPCLNGLVKVDGCSDWDYLTAECMAHFCGVKGLKKFFDMQVYLYALAAELMDAQGPKRQIASRPDEFFLDAN